MFVSKATSPKYIKEILFQSFLFKLKRKEKFPDIDYMKSNLAFFKLDNKSVCIYCSLNDMKRNVLAILVTFIWLPRGHKSVARILTSFFSLSFLFQLEN